MIKHRKQSEGKTIQPKGKKGAKMTPPPIQRKENTTGMPDQLKSGVENLSGIDMSDVKVHYNSSQPAQLQAHAYAQGNQIHIAPGQEKHLPHEAWHVVQQKQGRVKATRQMKGKVNVNDDAGLEREADRMGHQALQRHSINDAQKTYSGNDVRQLRYADSGAVSGIVQRDRVDDLKEGGHTFTKVIEVEMAGSGNDTITGKAPDGDRIDSGFEPTTWKKESPSRIKISVAGPGGPSTKGAAAMLGGMSDTGSNSIDQNVRHLLNMLQQLIAHDKEATSILLLIRAHSRNAVAATRVANLVHGKDKRVKVELVLFDPVPGPLHWGHDVSTDISAIPESTLIASVATQYPIGFTPQQVLGAKRIIISRQNHSGGLQNGYVYGGQTYQGSRLNSLPQGVYIDSNKTGETKAELKPVSSIGDAKKMLLRLFALSQSFSRDPGRLQILEEQFTHYFFEMIYEGVSFEAIWEQISKDYPPRSKL